jgi:7-cyano-7-deazaguanine reductase
LPADAVAPEIDPAPVDENDTPIRERAMATAEGRTLAFVGPEHIDVAVLETFPYEGPEQEIVTETDEFSAVCPYSGLPDFAKLSIRYVPGATCIELKSLKYYVTSYRNVGIFQEHATARIAEDLHRCLAPKWLEVRTVYNVRGGFLTTCSVRLPTS